VARSFPLELIRGIERERLRTLRPSSFSDARDQTGQSNVAPTCRRKSLRSTRASRSAPRCAPRPSAGSRRPSGSSSRAALDTRVSRSRPRCTDWLISGYHRLCGGRHIADLAHVAGSFLNPEEHSSGDAITGDQVTANPTVQIHSGVYPRMMGGECIPYGVSYFAQRDGQPSAPSIAAVERTCPTELIYCDPYTVRENNSIFLERRSKP